MNDIASSEGTRLRRGGQPKVKAFFPLCIPVESCARLEANIIRVNKHIFLFKQFCEMFLINKCNLLHTPFILSFFKLLRIAPLHEFLKIHSIYSKIDAPFHHPHIIWLSVPWFIHVCD